MVNPLVSHAGTEGEKKTKDSKKIFSGSAQPTQNYMVFLPKPFLPLENHAIQQQQEQK